jgi:hypothetical protein
MDGAGPAKIAFLLVLEGIRINASYPGDQQLTLGHVSFAHESGISNSVKETAGPSLFERAVVRTRLMTGHFVRITHRH